jgi:hypothetical protein
LYLQVCSGKEFRKHSARRVPSARRHRLPFPKKVNRMRKALPEIPHTRRRYFFLRKKLIVCERRCRKFSTPSAGHFLRKKGNRIRKVLPEIPNAVGGIFFAKKVNRI